MKVYVVEGGWPYDYSEVIGVYSTEQAAREAGAGWLSRNTGASAFVDSFMLDVTGSLDERLDRVRL